MVESGSIQKGGFAVRVEVPQSRAELLSGLDDFSGGIELPVADGVIDDLDGLEVSLEFNEIFHHGLRGRIEVLLAEGIEIFQPKFLEGGSDVLRFELFEQILHLVHGP